MPSALHPDAVLENHLPDQVDINGELYSVGEDGLIVGLGEREVTTLAEAHGMSPSDLWVEEQDTDNEPETCTEVMTNGEVCGRTLPCQYHS